MRLPFLVLALAGSVLVFSVAGAHPGKVAGDGCHFCRTGCDAYGVKTDMRHCHETSPERAEKSERRRSSSGKPRESVVSDLWCQLQGGRVSSLPDGTSPNCILSSEIVEFDWAKGMKPYECVGQALHYANQSGLTPKCVLIRLPNQSAVQFQSAVDKASGTIAVECVDVRAQPIACR